ncbi:MAG: SDR family oxidoreductase [Acidimicrobiales bacterium]
MSVAGARVIGVARDHDRLAALKTELGESFVPIVADATDPSVAGQLIDAYQPLTVVLNAGAAPLARPIHHHTWRTFSANWEVDVQQVFNWTREALLAPLGPDSTVIAFSSGAALRGSPMSGGYAGAKATIRFISAYGAAESDRAKFGIRFVSVLPQLTPDTELGAVAVAGYAKREGLDAAAFVERLGPVLTADRVGELIVEIAGNAAYAAGAYLVNGEGLTAAP